MNLRGIARKLWGCVRYSWNVIGISLLMFLLAEGSCRFTGSVQRHVAPPAERGAAGNDIFARVPWGPQYVRDVQDYRWKNRFEAFVEFRPRSVRTESVNISDDGIRVTPHNDAPHERNLILHLFGGSTMIGVGVPDWGTIPAYLSLRHQEEKVPHEIVNYATCWWTSSQSLAQLIVLLREGKRPKVVVFYDGINDVNVVSYGGRAGGISPKADAILRRGFKDEPSLARGILSHSLLLRTLLNRIRPDPLWKGSQRFTTSEAEIERGAAEIVKAYENNVRMVVALGHEFDFVPFLFWQPAPLIAQKPMAETDIRATADRLQSQAGEATLYARVYARIRQSEVLRGCSSFHDLQDIFVTEERPMYCDSEHLLPEGNELVARVMFDRIKNALSSSPGRAREPEMSR